MVAAKNWKSDLNLSDLATVVTAVNWAGGCRSRGENISVEAPESLRSYMRETLLKAASRYD